MFRFAGGCLLVIAALPAPAQIGAPVQSWAYGGCSVSSCQTGWYSGPAVADIDADGALDVVWGSFDTVALNGIGGGLKWRATSAQRVWPAIAVADFVPLTPGLESAVGRGRDSVRDSTTGITDAHDRIADPRDSVIEGLPAARAKMSSVWVDAEPILVQVWPFTLRAGDEEHRKAKDRTDHVVDCIRLSNEDSLGRKPLSDKTNRPESQINFLL